MSRGRGPVLTLCLVQFVDVLGVTVVITALPSMLAGLGAPASAATPVVTSYAMCFGGLLMLGSRVGDRYGHRRVLVAGLVLFGAGSLLAATASSLAWLVIARCIQGVSAAGSVPAALRLLSASADGEDARRRALAAWSATGAVAGASGLLLGGVLTQLAGWELMFWLNLPLAAVLVLAVLRTVAPSAAVPGRLDVGGAVLLTGAVMGLVLGCALLENAGRRLVGVALVGAGLVLLAAFRWVERRVAVPLLPAAAVGNRRLRLGSAAGFVNTAATSSAVTLATLYLQDTHGASPAEAGVALLPFSILVVVASATTAAPLMRRIGTRRHGPFRPRAHRRRRRRAAERVDLGVAAAGRRRHRRLRHRAVVGCCHHHRHRRPGRPRRHCRRRTQHGGPARDGTGRRGDHPGRGEYVGSRPRRRPARLALRGRVRDRFGRSGPWQGTAPGRGRRTAAGGGRRPCRSRRTGRFGAGGSDTVLAWSA